MASSRPFQVLILKERHNFLFLFEWETPAFPSFLDPELKALTTKYLEDNSLLHNPNTYAGILKYWDYYQIQRLSNISSKSLICQILICETSKSRTAVIKEGTESGMSNSSSLFLAPQISSGVLRFSGFVISWISLSLSHMPMIGCRRLQDGKDIIWKEPESLSLCLEETSCLTHTGSWVKNELECLSSQRGSKFSEGRNLIYVIRCFYEHNSC